MKLVASVLYNTNIRKDITILDGKLQIIDNFTSKFNRESLKKELEEFLKQKIDVSIKEIYIENEDGLRIPILYNSHAFFTLSENRNEVYRMLKYIDLDNIYPYFQAKSLYDEDFEILCKEIERCHFKADSRYYALFTATIQREYEKIRDLMLHVLSKEELKKFKNPQFGITFVEQKIFSKFLRNVLNQIPKQKEFEDGNNNDYYDTSQNEDFSYAKIIANNPYLTLEQKMLELELILDDPEEIRKYLD